MKIRNFISLFFLFFYLLVFPQKKALIIAIGNYPYKTGWSVINSENDVPVITNSLLSNGFEKENISILKDESATKKGIIMALTDLYNRSQPGDIVFIHYSGHGQQIDDDNDDELDGKDEALVPYNAVKKFQNSYKGENHIRDDEIENIIHLFRNKLGPYGQLFILLDSCHSGSSSKGIFFGDDEMDSTDLNPSTYTNIFTKTPLISEASPFVMLSSADAFQSSTEVSSPDQDLSIGALTFAFYKSLAKLGNNLTYNQLFSQVKIEMKEVAKNQNPVIEGDIDYKFFTNERINQQPYFEVLNTSSADTIRIQAGKAQFIFPGTTFFVMPAGANQVTKNEILTTGVVTNSSYNHSEIKLIKAIKNFDPIKYWVFPDQYNFEEAALKVSVETDNKETLDQLSRFLNKNKLGTIVSDSLESEVHISKKLDKTLFFIKSKTLLKDTIYSQSSENEVVNTSNKLVQIAHSVYLKKIQTKNSAYEFSFRLLPVEYDEVTKTVLKIKDSVINEPILSADSLKNYWIMEVSNKTDQPIFFNIIKFKPNGSFEPFFPNDSYKLNAQETMIPAKKTMAFKNHVFCIDSSETEIFLKGFSSPFPITIHPLKEDGITNQFKEKNDLKEGTKQNSVSASKTGEKDSENNSNADLYSVELLINIKK